MSLPFDSFSCVVEYLYRDAANYKTHGEAVLTGPYSREAELQIATALDADRVFVPEQVGLPPLQALHLATYGPEAGQDHALHEFVRLRPATDIDLIAGTPICALDAFISAVLMAGRRWDCRLSPYC